MYTTRFTYTPGLSLFAFPFNGDIEDADEWLALRVACTGGANGVYSVTVDDTDTDWAIFIGATQPSDFDKAKFEFSTEVAASQESVDAGFASVEDAVEAIETAEVIVTPIIGLVDTRVKKSTLPLYVGDTSLKTITLLDSVTLEPVDIEGITLELVVETGRKGDVKVFTDSDLTKSANTVQFEPTSAMVASERTLEFALKAVTSGYPFAFGIMPVTYVPRGGSS